MRTGTGLGRLAGALAGAVLVLAGAGCGDAQSRPAAPEAMAIAGAQLGGDGPGTLVSAQSMPGYDRTVDGQAMRSARVVYRSTSGDTGALTTVSGTVFTPLSPAPPGGWPVVSYGHGTLGFQEPCAPSLSANLLGETGAVEGFVKRGFAVAMADYQGLGSPGVHPYSDARTAGYNMIDAVRALRRTFGDVSNRWAAFGGSQGGGAAWSADEQAADYAPELSLVGAVGMSPAADVVGLVDKSTAGTLTPDQRPVLQGILYSLSRLHPDLPLDDYRRGNAVRFWDVLAACSGSDVHERGQIAEELGPLDLAPATPAAADRLRSLLTAWALPQRALSAPLYVEYGAQDSYIDPQWTTDALARACRLGGVIAWNEELHAGHGDVSWVTALGWLQDRFTGRPAPNDCP